MTMIDVSEREDDNDIGYRIVMVVDDSGLDR